MNATAIIGDYLKHVSDEDVRYLGIKLIERLQDDLPDVLEYIGKNSSRNATIDSLFKTADSSEELYNFCDMLQKHITEEAERRKISLVRGSKV